jgi:glucose-1-phosphate cytidylyltransferase
VSAIEDIPVVILAGGLGTRIREETEFKPKPMIDIGGFPIIWHLMKNFSNQGFNNFIICTGYKGNVIKDYFLNYETQTSDVKISLGIKKSVSLINTNVTENWNITVVDTGQETLTGGRVKAIAPYLQAGRFICTYGDGLANVNIQDLLSFHLAKKTIGTVTVVNPVSRFGVIEISDDNLVQNFREKPIMDSFVNGGFFIFENSFLEYLDLNSTLESDPLIKLSAEGQLAAFRHTGFWQPMDTYREMQMLNTLWRENAAPWKNW